MIASRSMSRRAGALLRRTFLLGGLIARAAYGSEPSDLDQFRPAVRLQEAIARHDYDLAYQYLVNGNQYKPAEALISDLLGLLEYLAWGGDRFEPPDRNNLQDWSDWYRRDLMMQVSPEERYWVACMMIRHKGELRSFKVLSDVADQFRATGQHFPRIEVKDSRECWPKFKDAEEEAFFRGKYDDLYRIVLPRTKGTGWEAADAAFRIATVLLYAPSSSFHLVPESERRRAGMAWLRKAADIHDHDALSELASIYRWGLNGLPQDAALAQCFKEARYDFSDVSTCRTMEQARGYVTEASPPKD